MLPVIVAIEEENEALDDGGEYNTGYCSDVC